MGKIESDKLQRLLDYHLNLDDPRQRLETQRQLADDSELQELDRVLQRSLNPLGILEDAEPAADLADRTLALVAQERQAQQMAQASADIVSNGSPRERRSRAKWVLSNLRDVIAVAASLMLVFVLMRPGMQQARNLSREQTCASQLRSVGFGLAQYAQDYRGRMPYVKRPRGAKWLPVNKPGDENYSNTRNSYLLVKMGYISIDTFVCPGTGDTQNTKMRVKMDPQALKQLQDFANRNQVNYSFFLVLNDQLFFSKQNEDAPIGSDQNPIFADFDSQTQGILDLSLHQELLNSNSPNHAGHGQNLLYGDGHVRFSSTRHVGLNHDDIFTLEGILRYDGSEQPYTDSDTILAP
jgi:hypothetical protein